MFTSHNKTFSEITSRRNAQYSVIYTGHIISHSHWTRVFPCWPFQLSWVFFFLVHAPPLKLDQPDLLALDCFLMSVLTHGMGSWRSVTRLFLLSKLYALRPPLCHTRSSILYSAPERLWNVLHKFTYKKKKWSNAQSVFLSPLLYQELVVILSVWTWTARTGRVEQSWRDSKAGHGLSVSSSYAASRSPLRRARMRVLYLSSLFTPPSVRLRDKNHIQAPSPW